MCSFEFYYYQSGGGGRKGKATLSVRKSGGMTLGQQLVAAHNLERFQYVGLYYDKRSEFIAMKFSEDEFDGSAPIMRTANTREIRHNGFVRKHNIAPGEYELVRTAENGLLFFSNARIDEEKDNTSAYFFIRVPNDLAIEELEAAIDLVGGTIV